MSSRMNWKKLTRDERIEILKSGIERGLSAQQIANEVGGCTKGAIIGLSHKTGIRLPGGNYESTPKVLRPSWSKATLREREAVVRAGLAAKLSYKSIAERFTDATPKAIKSFVGRMRARDMFVPPPTKEAARKAVFAKALPSVESPLPIVPETAPLNEGFVNIMDIISGQCRAPQWEDRPRRPLRSPDDWMYCGKPIKPGTSYCIECGQRFLVKPDGPQRFDRRVMSFGYAK